jgi:hypothetical protein
VGAGDSLCDTRENGVLYVQLYGVMDMKNEG